MPRPNACLFFGTCLIDLARPEAGLAAMRLLHRAGVQVHYPQAQTCCGQSAYNSGWREQARRVALAQIDALTGPGRDGLPIVVPSASCAGMMRLHYPDLFADGPHRERAVDVAGRVVELCDFLYRVLALEFCDRGPPINVAIHHSCSARRALGEGPVAGAQALLGQLGAVTVVEQDHAYECCGFGGTFAVKQPTLSAAMAADKAAAIAATGAELLLGQDLGCLLNIDGTARHADIPVPVVHIGEFLWRRSLADAPSTASPEG
jgi:L-lactate dehydrogenase complex protein LldE